MRKWLTGLQRRFRLLIVFLITLLLLGRSSLPPDDQTVRVRAFTRPHEFDFVSWTLEALSVKGIQASIGASGYLSADQQSQLVLDYLNLVVEIRQVERQLNVVYTDPNVQDPVRVSEDLHQQLTDLKKENARLGPLAESALQAQLQHVLTELDLALGGQPIPPVLYHTTSTPLALIVSPREVIRQDNNISIDPDLTLDQQVALENKIDQDLDVASLVVPVGGIGTYPPMVSQTSDINWLAEVVAHEWIHNYLTLRPLGVQVFQSPEMLTINETVASIAGKEIGRALVAKYYPERLPPLPDPTSDIPPPKEPAEPLPFDFRAEMAETRETVDQMLADGQIKAAEAYMESRRIFFWENGYRLRKLNQAYFAFFGSYADQPGGAAGEDPVGGAVRTYRAQSPTLARFVKQISWISSFDQLQSLIEEQ